MTQQGACNAGHNCAGEVSAPCTPYVCNGNTACFDDCATHGDADCVANHYCDGSDVCQPKKPNGNACAADHECTNGHCPPQDLVCCDGACDTLCRACTTAKKGGGNNGICGDVANNTDPDNECGVGGAGAGGGPNECVNGAHCGT